MKMQEKELMDERHACYECSKGRRTAYTARPWQGPCYICQKRIFTDRILKSLCLTCEDSGKVWNPLYECEEVCKCCAITHPE